MSKITVYMTHGEIAALDQIRVELLREGVVVDRSRMARAAFALAAANVDAWVEAMKEDVSGLPLAQ